MASISAEGVLDTLREGTDRAKELNRLHMDGLLSQNKRERCLRRSARVV